MNNGRSQLWWHGRKWTLGLCLAMVFANLGLFNGAPAWFSDFVGFLQYDRNAIADGELWRLITGNLVHWSVEHFALDVGVFLIVGHLYEPIIGRAYPWLIAMIALVVGGLLFLFQPELAIYRGLSGVDSGQFAAALGIECSIARREKRRWLWVAPAAAIFLGKIAFECSTGRLFFGTESLGDIGQPVPLAHAAGLVSAWGVMCLDRVAADPRRAVVAGLAGYVCPWSFETPSRPVP